jgi:hypothetical protein
MVRKNYFTPEEQQIMKKLHKNDEKKEHPKTLTGMMMGFHGRPLISSEDKDYEDIYPVPAEARPIGLAKKVFYDSDKRDPASPKGEGRQGVMKRFVHEHDKKPVVLYELTTIRSKRHKLPNEKLSKLYDKSDWYMPPECWADECGYIGELVCIEYEGANGYEVETFNNFDLYVWDDMKTLMARPRTGDLSVVLLWRGPDLMVNWRGIIH